MPDLEGPLSGGNTTSGVVRVGDTLRRPAGPWSIATHALLGHLESVGFVHAPHSYGFDDQGRHVLEFIVGETEDQRTGSGVETFALGSILRDLHDATETFVAPEDAAWLVAIEPNATDLVTHNDVAPWNLVHGPHGVVLIDWDAAGPGSRLWELAYAANAFTPLAPEVDVELAGGRLRALAAGYGLDEPDRAALADLLVPRILSMFDLLRRGNDEAVEPWARLWREGHGATWWSFAEYAREHATGLRRALLDG